MLNIERTCSRQKIRRPQTFRIENEYNPEAVTQYFQITVNVLEARKLSWSNPQTASSYVVVSVGKRRRRTNVRRNMEEPFYREYFVFELYTSVREIQRTNLRLAIMETRRYGLPRLLGESNIDLSSIWSQPYHQVYHKWAQLILPRDPATGPVGFLKVDIAITGRDEVQHIPSATNDDKVEENLLLPSGSEQQRANYIINIYNAYALPSGTHCYGDQHYGKPPSSCVKVTFCGLSAKTTIVQSCYNPVYNEQISIVEMFPNMCQDIHLEVCSGSKVLCGAHLRLSEISNDGDNGFLPTFGPSLIHMNGPACGPSVHASFDDGPYYKGSLVVSLKIIVPYYQRGIRSIIVNPTQQLEVPWTLEHVCVYCPIFEVSMLDRKIAGNSCGIAITMGEIPDSTPVNEELMTTMNEIKNRKLYYTGQLNVNKTRPAYGHLNFAYAYPVLMLMTVQPDFRFRMYRNNSVNGIISELDTSVTDVERRLRTFEYESLAELDAALNGAVTDISNNILKFLDDIPTNSDYCILDGKTYSTELDNRQLDTQKQEIEKIYQQLTSNSQTCVSRNGEGDGISRKTIKIRIAELKDLLQCLNGLVFKSCEGWPDIVIWLLNGGSRIAYSRISVADVIHSTEQRECGRDCGRIQTIYMKPLKCPKHMTTMSTGCFCIAAKVELLMWLGLCKHKATFPPLLPEGYTLRTKDIDICVKADPVNLECRAFVYRAKLSTGVDTTGLANPYVRINILNIAKDTQVKPKTLTPLWNQVLTIKRTIIATPERIKSNPPIALVEVYDKDEMNDLIGRVQVEPTVDERRSYDYAPKLQWYDIYKGAEYTGQILMSVQLLKLPKENYDETVDENERLIDPVESSCIKDSNIDVIENIPPHLIPESTTYKLDLYWWGLRDMTVTRKPCAVLEIDELAVKSQSILHKKKNCNFPDGKASETFYAPLKEAYCPPLSIRLYDSGTFGRSIFIGTNVIKNPNKYFIKWLTREERDSCVRRATVMSSSCIGTDLNYSRISLQNRRRSIEAYSAKTKANCEFRNVFKKTSSNEEECTLLPVFTRKDNNSRRTLPRRRIKSYEPEYDWWMRFYCSQKENAGGDHVCKANKITIYNSELESQPEFSKFKDWCATLRLYNGKKTGIPDKDEQLVCGFLKAGIAIYKWPPPEDTVAVSPTGVELHRGCFDEYPGNDPVKFLVRVYVLKGINLMPKDINGRSDPYVIVKCGKKKFGDRKHYVPRNVNPVFGKIFEFRSTLPEDYLLSIYVYDHDTVPPDDLIGCTTIDLEDRVYSKHRAMCGLALEYTGVGADKWRDYVRPSAILEELCIKNHLPQPILSDPEAVIFNGTKYNEGVCKGTYNTASELQENICLSLLHNWHCLPCCGHPLVPEHVETRTLYNPDRPGLNQGKIQMWVDMFPLEAGSGIPPAIDVTPHKVKEYELRVVVWDVEGIKLDDYDVVAGQKSSDIYVKAWIGDPKQAQQTDIHYRSLTGVGNFNWRMIFHFKYQYTERRLIIKQKGIFHDEEDTIPPILAIQVMDSDAISADDFLGSLMLNLNGMPRGAKVARQAKLQLMEDSRKINMFSVNSLRGWYPLRMIDHNGESLPAGCIDLELTLLPKEKAIVMPVGIGREGPKPLPPPKRPETSFSIFTNPLHALKGTLRRCGPKSIVIVICLTLVALIVITIALDLPRILLERWLGCSN